MYFNDFFNNSNKSTAFHHSTICTYNRYYNSTYMFHTVRKYVFKSVAFYWDVDIDKLSIRNNHNRNRYKFNNHWTCFRKLYLYRYQFRWLYLGGKRFSFH